MVRGTAINPWTWQDPLNFSQAVEVRNAPRTVYLAGQTSVDGEGNVLHATNMAAQINQAFDNMETVLAKAGLTMANVVRLNYYTTDINAFFAASAVVGQRLASVPCKPAGVLLGVAALFHPDAMIEIEATAAD
jgi:enamine deaminase RidA (YjgF/YER057c/UK114 family)